jgi:polyferredoxin
VIGYTAVLLVLLSVLGYLFLSRSSVQATALRAPGTLYQEKPGNVISNLYTLKVINKTNKPMILQVKILEPAGGSLTLVGGDIAAPAGDIAQSAFFVDIPRARLTGEKTFVVIGLFAGSELMCKVSTAFLGPIPDEL